MMKDNKQLIRYILFILGATMLIIGLSGCEKSDADKLRGRWQFRYCEYPEGGTFSTDSVFYSFDRGVFELQKLHPDNNSTRLYGQYTVDNDSLSIHLPSVYMFDPQASPYYFDENDRKEFRIDDVSRKELVMSCRDTVYHFHKF